MAGSIYDRMMGTPQYDSNAGTSALNSAANAFQGMASTFHNMRQSIIDEEQKNLQREMEKQHHQEEMDYKDRSLAQDYKQHSERLDFERLKHADDMSMEQKKLDMQWKLANLRSSGGGGGGGRRGSGGSGADGTDRSGAPENPYLDRYINPNAGIGKKGGNESKKEYRRIASGRPTLPALSKEPVDIGISNDNKSDSSSDFLDTTRSTSKTPKLSSTDAALNTAFRDLGLGDYTGPSTILTKKPEQESFIPTTKEPSNSLRTRFQENVDSIVAPSLGQRAREQKLFEGLDTSKLKDNAEALGIDQDYKTPSATKMAPSVYNLQSLSDPVPNLLLEQRYRDQGTGPKESAFDYDASQRDFELQGVRGTGVQTGRAMQLERDVPSTRYEALKTSLSNAARAQLEAEQNAYRARRDFYNKAESDYDLPARYAFDAKKRAEYNQALLDWSEGKKLAEGEGLLTPAEEAYQDMDKAYKAYQEDQKQQAAREQERKQLEDMKASKDATTYGKYQNALQQFRSHIPSEFEVASYDPDNPRASQLGVDLQNLGKATRELYGVPYSVKDSLTKQQDDRLATAMQDPNSDFAVTQNINAALNREEPTADALVFNDTNTPVVSDNTITLDKIGFNSSNGINSKLLATYDGSNLVIPDSAYFAIGDRNPYEMNNLITRFQGLKGFPKSTEEIQKETMSTFNMLVGKSPEIRAQYIVMLHGLAERTHSSSAREGYLAVARGLALSLNSGYNKMDANHRALLRGRVKSFIGLEPTENESKAGTAIEAARHANEYEEGHLPRKFKQDDYAKYVTGYEKLVPAAKGDMRDLMEDLPRTHNIAKDFIRSERNYNKIKNGKDSAPDVAVRNMRTAILSTALELWGEWYLEHSNKEKGPTDADIRAFRANLYTPGGNWYKRLQEGTESKLGRIRDRRSL